jgi:hypothetical protein
MEEGALRVYDWYTENIDRFDGGDRESIVCECMAATGAGEQQAGRVFEDLIAFGIIDTREIEVVSRGPKNTSPADWRAWFIELYSEGKSHDNQFRQGKRPRNHRPGRHH